MTLRKIFFAVILLASISVFGQENKNVTKRLEEKYYHAYFSSDHGGYYTIKKVDYDPTNSPILHEGVCDKYGKEIIPPVWDRVSFYRTYYEVTKNGFVGIRDLNNRELLPCDKYTRVQWYQKEDKDNGGYCEVAINKKVGAIGPNNQEVIPCEYDWVSPFQIYKYGCAEVRKSGRTGVYDVKQKREVIPCEYDGVYSFQVHEHGYVNVKKDDKRGIYDVKKGKEIIPCEYGDIDWSIEGNYCIVYKYKSGKMNPDNRVGLISKSNEVILPCEYTCIHIDNDTEVAVVGKDGIFNEFQSETLKAKYALYDIKKRKFVTDFKYGYIERPYKAEKESLLRFNLGGQVESYKNYQENVVGGKWGYLDLNGNEVIPAKYDAATAFNDGVAHVTENGVSSMIVNPLKGASVKMAEGKNDIAIDINIPATNKNNKNTFAFIIANENYAHFSGADYSINDGKVFAEYCKKTLNIPEKNVRYYEDATYGNIVGALQKMQDIADVYEGDAKMIFYYSGLGAIDEKSQERFLLPTDVSMAALGTTGYRVAELLQMLDGLNVEYTWVVMDASFANVDKNGKNLFTARGVAIKPKTLALHGKTIVSMACDDGQTAFSHRQYGHSLFTYALLEKMQQTKGICTVKELADSASSRVKKMAMGLFDKIQVPVVRVSERMDNLWNNVKF